MELDRQMALLLQKETNPPRASTRKKVQHKPFNPEKQSKQHRPKKQASPQQRKKKKSAAKYQKTRAGTEMEEETDVSVESLD